MGKRHVIPIRPIEFEFKKIRGQNFYMAVLYFVLIVKLKLGDTCTTSYMVHEWADSNGEMERFREEQEERNKKGLFNGQRRTLGDFAEMWSGGEKKRRRAEMKRWRFGAEGCRFEHLDDNGVMKVAFLQLMDRWVLKGCCVEVAEGKFLNVKTRGVTRHLSYETRHETGFTRTRWDF